MKDPYQTLGVARSASADEIKSAYRKLAKKLHPDLNPGDKTIELKFRDVTAAYDLLSDPDKRTRFDRGEIDAQGNERPDAAFRRAYAGGGGFGGFGGGFGGQRAGMGGRPGGQAFEADMFGDVLDELLRGGGGPGGRGGRARPQRGADLRLPVRVPFLTAVNGGSVRVSLPGGRAVDLRIPAAAVEGQILRLSGQGEPGINGGPAGDTMVELRIEPHPVFRREGEDIHADVPVSLSEAVLGARIEVPTVNGSVMLTVPPGSTGRNTLRLRGKGLRNPETGRAGDQYVHLRITLPENADEELRRFAERWSAAHPYDPRADLGA